MSRQPECPFETLDLIELGDSSECVCEGEPRERKRERLCLPFNDLLVQGTDRLIRKQSLVCVDGDWEAFTRCCSICVCSADFAVLSFLESHNCVIIVITPFYR